MSYMLDENVWKDFKNTNLAEFAVGGPSIEILNKAYYEVIGYDDFYPSYKVNEYGYAMNEEFFYTPKEDNRVEFLYTKSNRSNYILSTSANSRNPNIGNEDDCLIAYDSTEGYTEGYNILSTDHAINNFADYSFRPMVCLKSDVKLIEETNGTLSISK